MDLCKYVDVFYGNSTPQLPKPNETASKWFFLKAQVGNTTPAAVRPFGMVSASPYTGGYPTGYGPFLPNSYARPSSFLDENNITALGFSHFHQSGTGYIGEFYNYSVITPVCAKESRRFDRFSLTDEKASPGFYSCKLGDIKCRVTVSETAAVYIFDFNGSGGNKIAFDPILNGIFKDETTPFTEFGNILFIETDGDCATTSVNFDNGVTLHTALSCRGCKNARVTDESRVIFDVDGDSAEVSIGFSFDSIEKAKLNLSKVINCDFETIKVEGEKLWNDRLSAIIIEDDGEYKTKFYSNFYRCMIKPTRLGCDNGFGIDDACCSDFATLWDMSKTQLPLIFTLFGDVSTDIISSFVSYFKKYGFFPNSFLLNGCDSSSDNQARALAVSAVYDAYLRGVDGIDWFDALLCMIGELKRDVNKNFFEKKAVSEFASHTIDLAVAAYSISELASALGKTDIAEEYLKLSENFECVYDRKSGVIYEDGRFYEGCNLNYSFRLLPDMKKRIELAGGAQKFEKSLDEFFGFDKKAAVQILDSRDILKLKKGEARRGFEGFNNETDMETPYCYCYIGRQDKTCEIVRSGEKYLYGSKGKGALCGNEDSGALSSLYVVNALGVFPCFGQNRIILGSPALKSAKITLLNGNTVKITTENFNEEKFIPKKILFNKKELSEPFITVKDFMAGCEIEFIM